MERERFLDKCRGSLVGGAVGDALGYEVEFMSLASIRRRFGRKGISEYVLDGNGVAPFSDDTQMTLFTAEGILTALAKGCTAATAILPFIEKAYLDWYMTQTSYYEHKTGPQNEGLLAIKELWSRRAPGNTCLDALCAISIGNQVRNNSKGCGGVMRVAPVGICMAVRSASDSDIETVKLAGEAAEITHKHIDSTFASALMALIVRRCLLEDCSGRERLADLIEECMQTTGNVYLDSGAGNRSGYTENHRPMADKWEAFCKLIRRAVELGMSEVTQEDAIRELGEGWVGDEALAVALFSVVRHIDGFEDCMVCAVNHDGDSDSTGAIAGNILGAILGYSAIPAKYLTNLELHDLLLSMSGRLASTSGILIPYR